MSESVVADFPGRFYSHQVGGEPPNGRILLNKTQLVLVADDFKENIPVSNIFDVQVGEVPDELRMYFNDTVTVAYEADDTRRFVAIEGDDKHIERFSTVLFKVLLNGTPTLVRHPARRGGRVTDEDPVTATLDLQWEVIGFESSGGARVEIDLDDVIGVDRSKRDIGAGSHPVVDFRHLTDGEAITTEAGIKSPRKTNLLGRYVRMRYSDIEEELADTTITDEEEEILVALYTAPGVSLSNVVDFNPQRLTMVLRGLREKGLIADTKEETTLTMKGKVVAGNRIEQVNT
ncbi:CheF family chemotaxis protein [Halobaculum sp. MBLA0147]|uniref:CheF family chemotaxis protein n=1 Tax=Halobaculum sp. MBLA0147 TaxID=3079934 RepID=UPI0035255BE6